MVIGIIGAMKEEIELMKEEMDIEKETKVAKITFYAGTMENHQIVLCKSGVGKVNAALTTQILIDHFQVEKIIFTGVAGALNPRLDIGDIVISTSALQHDIDASPLGFKRGEIPMFEHTSDFPANTALIELATKASEQLNIQVIKGKVLSGDQFIASQELVHELYETFSGACVEMEGSAVAQAAMLNDIPYVIIRSISDKANGEAKMSFNEFVHVAAKQSNFIVKAMLEHME
ncbi:5'-methylthioadenosine/S-adenosylhomocysteine nucleosidase [Alkalihalophilus pseudofirmus]|uniref:5'-methylthioadenosine/adenosylhomocysteine nucleosidase n=1 Tax=Alkalihalobacterium alkalinitrilicum TaxID=427920 RepID=UPI00094D7911|nr:5'-methylthioadenosine/adenosylhomocysteine nucleosidase [Alkalihalobacterium alkalinitrilicum]OLO40222.1 5'-methylthioadenosine/S-adenosylhomocysteine nucleosidase [Alkalihalophilus pseudofirmus]